MLLNRKWLQLIIIQLICLPIFIKTDIINNYKTNEMHYAELILIANLDGYIKNLENQLINLNSNLEFYKHEHKEAEKDIVTYLSNPLNAYLLTKRLTTDWKHVENIMQYDSGIEYVQNITKESIQGYFPNENDLKNAVLNLAELQQQYHLTVKEIASGTLDGIQFGKSFSAVDCFEIGRNLILKPNILLAKKWLQESLNRYDNNNIMIREENILDLLSWCNLNLGNLEEALEQSKAAFVLNPTLEHIYKNIQFIQSKINDKDDNGEWSIVTDNHNNMDINIIKYKEEFKKGCKGKLKKSPIYEKYLICTYLTVNHPFLKLAPFKIEEIHDHPIIIIVYDIISNDEIKQLKNLTKNELNFFDDNLKIIKKFTMSDDTNNSVLSILDQRIADITYLNVIDSEKLQILKSNYDQLLTPQYDLLIPDQDSTGKFIDYHKGNRIATGLIYLNDVEGGETVFPLLETVIKPKKGTAAFWYNLHANGKQDMRMLRSDCPVLSGPKWIANKWIRERNQEFRRPCEIISDDIY